MKVSSIVKKTKGSNRKEEQQPELRWKVNKFVVLFGKVFYVAHRLSPPPPSHMGRAVNNNNNKSKALNFCTMKPGSRRPKRIRLGKALWSRNSMEGVWEDGLLN